jgi:uncharacterized protein
MESQIKDLIKRVDYSGLTALLSQNPALANEPIALEDNPAKAHPLHRICDGVFDGRYSDNQAADMARIFLQFGANVDGNISEEQKDTPLVAAASLQADEVALLYIDHGANILHAGCHGGTALHWAAWCGRERLVKRLIIENAPVNRKCVAFKGTPLLWAVHGYKFGGSKNRHRQIQCVHMLLQAGADKNIPNAEGTRAVEFLGEEDVEMKQILLNR